jgi:hypothetical protein
MKISRDTWHFRVFNGWFKKKKGFSFDEWYGSDRPYNLCPYVRAVLLWAPARFLFSPPRIWATIPVLLVSFVGLIYRLAGTRGLLALLHAVEIMRHMFVGLYSRRNLLVLGR